MLELNGVGLQNNTSNSNNPASSMLSMLNMNIHEARNHHHHHHPASHPHPFQFLGSNASHAPLSALHSMTDLKNLSTNVPSAAGTNNSSFSPRNHSPINHKSNTANITTATTVATTTSASSPSSNSSGSSVGTPHGIQDILSRPTSFGPGVTPNSATVSAALGTALATGALPRFSLAGAAAVAASQGMYFNAAAANSNLHKLAAGLGDLSTRHLYWPQMVQNQALWRERFSGSGRRTFCSLFV